MPIFQDKGWRGKMQDVAASIDEHLGGERLLITPVKQHKPNYQATYDHAAAFCVIGLFDLPSQDVKLNMEETKVSSRNPEAVISYEQLAGRTIGHEYLIKRVDTGDIYQVTQAQPDGVSSVVVELVQIGLAPNR